MVHISVAVARVIEKCAAASGIPLLTPEHEPECNHAFDNNIPFADDESDYR